MKTTTKLKKISWRKVSKNKNSTLLNGVILIGTYFENKYVIESWAIEGGGEIYMVYYSSADSDHYYQFSNGLLFETIQSAKRACQEFLNKKIA
jgi:hypothetical protein